MQRNIVLDTNCLLQIIARQSKNYFLWEGFLQKNKEVLLRAFSKLMETDLYGLGI